MLIKESYIDVPTQAGGDMRIFIFAPVIDGYPQAKFPGVVVFSEIYQGRSIYSFQIAKLTGSLK
jgi:carboxymethylenebutenolidase